MKVNKYKYVGMMHHLLSILFSFLDFLPDGGASRHLFLLFVLQNSLTLAKLGFFSLACLLLNFGALNSYNKCKAKG